ncbi:glycosyltransferase family 2 protein [Bacillus sp. USDA818B3_A]|uniref:glycosyltransferase family 2 protein n=1 Tax=Bacillus sp. USDA818B3_A TaxID=2698834 RepID=UPI001370D314|nr:glycosyltransferase [Bacillus sp. USDA818B3_A]
MLENNSNHEIEVSIIIPSQNKYPLNLLTLYSLEKQTFNPNKMEVVFINDASTDETERTLQNYHPPYHFQYIHSTQNLGRARVRNLGVQSAKGSIIIFLDAEMITEPDFVENHYNYHQTSNKVIVSGAMYSKALYSCIYPAFSDEILNMLGKLTKNNQQVYKRYKNCSFPLTKPYQLLEKKDIDTGTYKDLSFHAYPWFQEITSNFNEEMEGFSFPWMAFLTGNISMRKELIIKAGLFDEEFYHYGYEDWELGYRLYQMGAQYINSNQMVTYHQEHPVGERKWREAVGNFGLFTIKHHDMDVLILALELARMTDLMTMNNILKEYKSLLGSDSDEFKIFSEKLVYILETITLLLEVDIRHKNILGAAGFSSKARKELKKDMKKMKKLYPNLSQFIYLVINS